MKEFKYSNVEKEMEVYGFDSVVKSHCRGCHGGCGVYVYVKDGKVAKIQGDPDCPINEGSLCPKGLAAIEFAYHPERIKSPMKRAGRRGEGGEYLVLIVEHREVAGALVAKDPEL